MFGRTLFVSLCCLSAAIPAFAASTVLTPPTQLSPAAAANPPASLPAAPPNASLASTPQWRLETLYEVLPGQLFCVLKKKIGPGYIEVGESPDEVGALVLRWANIYPDADTKFIRYRLDRRDPIYSRLDGFSFHQAGIERAILDPKKLPDLVDGLFGARSIRIETVDNKTGRFDIVTISYADLKEPFILLDQHKCHRPVPPTPASTVSGTQSAGQKGTPLVITPLADPYNGGGQGQ